MARFVYSLHLLVNICLLAHSSDRPSDRTFRAAETQREGEGGKNQDKDKKLRLQLGFRSLRPALTPLLSQSPSRSPGARPLPLWGLRCPSEPASHHVRGCGELWLLHGCPGAADAGGDPATQLLASVHCARECHHHQHHLREPLAQLRD